MTFSDVVAEYLEWAEQTFPVATVDSIVEHLRREVAELVDDPTDPAEIADVLSLTFHLAYVAGVDPTKALAAKLEINKAREWGKPDAAGVVEHVREEEART